MPRAADAVTSDSEAERPRTGSVQKKYSTKKTRRASSDVEDISDAEDDPKPDKPPESAGEDEEGEEEEEYEIEAILDAKKGQFPGELIDEFWAQRRKNKMAPRKSEPVRSKPKSISAKPSRKSLAQESSPEAEAPTKKRARAKNAEAESEPEVVDVDSEEPRAKKKPRKSNGANRKVEKADSEDEVEIGDMKKYMTTPTWEHVVESVDTVERDADGELIVYFTLKNGKGRKRENSRTCAEKFPQKLIKFYESNLRWKAEDGETEN
ncbi:hypothetical protein ID866_11049 [Astraeus odoratus]|nr:hypothetical protein ID866_11049 [Astraeus odoratus]